MTKPTETLLLTKGHTFEREPFFKMIDTVAERFNLNVTHVEQPDAQALLTPYKAAPYDAIVFYDMPGVTFTRSHPPFAHFAPSEEHKRDFMALVNDGKGMVFLHHAVASWPTWPEYAEVIGARFHFLPGELGGKSYQGSGYRFSTRQSIEVLDPSHPIVDGVSSGFEIQDEVYLFPVLEDKVTPLLRSDFNFVSDKFHHGGINFREHPPGSRLVGWTKTSGASPVAYLQFGHGPSAYDNLVFQRLFGNAIRWASSPEALEASRRDSQSQAR